MNHQTGRIQTKTVYAVTCLTPEQAGPARLAELVRDHCSAEALHHVRDVTYGEDASRIAPAQHLASWPPYATSPLVPMRQADWHNIAAATDHYRSRREQALVLLQITS
ncbi:hypothetical protein ACFYZB_43690 [Streptomyces sp. NPDC001852]|uniref:hypothetical protein n=1 Tax=Streptomyces sp. NPDC001852 TaxID=3364619 RepID=UPI0036781ABB